MKKKFNDFLGFQIASVAEVTGVAKKTPMALILNEWGIEPDLKYLS